MRWRTNNLLLGVILFSISSRIAAAFYMGDHVQDLPGIADQISYHNLALRVLTGHGFTFDTPWWPVTAAEAPSAMWSYLYTLFLVAIYTLFGPHPLVARIVQVVIVGVLHPYCAYRIGRHVFNE